MPQNRFALIRYKTIDNCLRNRYRKWTLEDLVEACTDVLTEYEGIRNKVGLRTIQLDIQNMRSEKLGYNAPIIVVDKKYYTYEDADYSITNMPLSYMDIDNLLTVTHTLKQFEGFSQFSDIGEALKKIENKVFAIHNPDKIIIDFEKNNNLKGINYLDMLYDAIKNDVSITIKYHSFNADRVSVFYMSPYLLKEYRNRWFVFGKPYHKRGLVNLALDRIVSMEQTSEYPFENNVICNFNEYFKDLIGVTKLGQKPIEVKFWIHKNHVPYVVTKPFHASQQILYTSDDGAVFSIKVIPNIEMEKEFLSFGEYVKILAPENLVERFKNKAIRAYELYTQKSEP